jgi:hypothetical protein
MEIIKVTYSDGTTGEQVVIASGDGFTTMSKSTYDAQQAELKVPKVVDEAAPE